MMYCWVVILTDAAVRSGGSSSIVMGGCLGRINIDQKHDR
jgi:hypothetical protein